MCDDVLKNMKISTKEANKLRVREGGRLEKINIQNVGFLPTRDN